MTLTRRRHGICLHVQCTKINNLFFQWWCVLGKILRKHQRFIFKMTGLASLLGEGSHGKTRRRGKRETSVSPLMHFLSRMPWRTVSTGCAYSTLNKMGFKNQLVSATNVVSGYMKEHIMITGWQRSLSFLSFFSWHERPQLLSRELSSGPVLIVCKCP